VVEPQPPEDQTPDPSILTQTVSDVTRMPTLAGVAGAAVNAGVEGVKSLYNKVTDFAHGYDTTPVDYNPFPNETPPDYGIDPNVAAALGKGIVKAAAGMPEGMAKLVTDPGKISSATSDLNAKIAKQGYVSEEDAAQMNFLSSAEMQWAPAMATQMVAGGPGAGAEEATAGIAGGKLTQPDHPAMIDARQPRVKSHVVEDRGADVEFMPVSHDPFAQLPMDEASRMTRAQEQGFVVPAFHGTSSAFDQFGRIEGGNARGEGYYFSTSPETASRYATGDVNRISPSGNAEANVMPVLLRMDKPFDENAMLSKPDLRAFEKALIDSGEPWKKGEFVNWFDYAYPPNGANVLQTISYNPADQNAILRKLRYDGRIGFAIDRTGSGARDIMVFSPEQVRSRYASFDPKSFGRSVLLGSGSTDERMSTALTGLSATEQAAPAPRFYSAVENAVNNAKTNSAPASQWLGMLKNTPGLKQEEMDWIGLNDWLKDQKGNVTKQQIGDFVRANKVDVQEVEKDDVGGAKYLTATEPNQRKTKFDQYTLPGGEPDSYRELLLTMPSRSEVVPTSFAVEPDGHGTYQIRNTFNNGIPYFRKSQIDAQAIADRLNDGAVNVRGESKNFRSSHWDEPNVLAHVRFDDRNIDGDKTLHLSELQSDLHQRGRKVGYAEGEPKTIPSFNPDELKMETREHDYRGTAPDGRVNNVGKGVVGSENEAREYLARYMNKTAAENNMAALAAHRAKVPDFPFKTSWHELAMKRMLRYASENGYDRLSWDTGATNVERYDLNKQIDTLTWNPESGELRAFKGDEPVIKNQNVPKEKLPDFIGKEAADRLISAGPSPNSGWHWLEGDDLKVGGSGMRSFYDKILPAAANKLVKKYGAKVEDSSISAPDFGKYDIIPVHGKWRVSENGNRVTDKDFKSADEARQWLRSSDIGKTAVHSIKITPELRKAAMQQGFPLFADGGAVSYPSVADPYADFRPSTNIEDVRDKPVWQKAIEAVTRVPLAQTEAKFGVNVDPNTPGRAHGGRVEPRNINHDPSEGQKTAGNYAKDKIHIFGLPITVENAKGSVRRGVGENGRAWESTLPAHYGYIRGHSPGADGDSIDAYIGPHQKASHIYVVDQINEKTKRFDEHKAMLGFGSEKQAINTYVKAFSDGKGKDRIGNVTGMTVSQFRDWLQHGDTTKPFAHVASRKERVRDILARHGVSNVGRTPSQKHVVDSRA
jgi:Inorganic Pyrophosphatase/ADP-Ribosyltransferase in polyvalent proteins